MPVLISIAALVSAVQIKGGLPWSAASFVAIFLLMMVIRTLFEVRLGRSGEASDTLERVLLVMVFLGMGPIPFLFVATPVFGFADYALPVPINTVAAIIGVLGLALFYRSHVDLDRQWSVSLAIQDGHALVDTGVYRLMRHPMYSALFLIVIAQAGLLSNWLAGFAGLVTFGTLYVLRVGREEALMASSFGEAWQTYAKRTPRLIPLSWGNRER
ncbi:MAG: protein-S-isoprenylcysteine O-methyltransferase [Pseudomonadota bacterium]